MWQHLLLLTTSRPNLRRRRSTSSIIERVHSRIRSIVDAPSRCRQTLALDSRIIRCCYYLLILLTKVVSVHQQLLALGSLLSLHLSRLRRLSDHLLVVTDRLLQLRWSTLLALR